MKKLIPFLMLSALVVFAGCSDGYDDTEIREEITDLDKRVYDLEGITSELKLKIDGLNLISSVTPLTGSEGGWKLTFGDGSSLQILNGLNGANGADGKDGANGTNGKDGADGTNGTNGSDGADGKDGATPYIYVDAAGYWCMNYTGARPDEADETERMLDENGDPISARGTKGEPGDKGADGVSQYVHIRYSATADGSSGLSVAPKAYVGTAVTTSPEAPESAAAYAPWSLLQGSDGAAGSDAQYLYIMYASDESGSDMSPESNQDSYWIGITTSASLTAPTDPTAYEWSLFRGADGTSQYMHIRYSATKHGEMSAESDDNTAWIAVATTETTEAPTDVEAYVWNRIKGVAKYLFVRYSANANGAAMTVLPEENSEYLGVLSTANASLADDYTAYDWSHFRGADGSTTTGTGGLSQYLHIRYSPHPDGYNMTAEVYDNSYYIGTLVNTDAVASADWNDYHWVRLQGLWGYDGETGEDGVTYYAYIRYSANPDGSEMTESARANTKYIGYTHTTATEAPDNYQAYSWSSYVGANGANGTNGDHGKSVHVRYSADDGDAPMTTALASDTQYIGVLIAPQASNDKDDYAWKKLTGDNGSNGTNGDNAYVHIAYRSGSDNTTMSNSWFADADHIGFETSTDSDASADASDYDWYLIAGANGGQGEQGVVGESVFVRYSADQTTMTTAPVDGTQYIGIYVGTEAPATASSYTWYLFVPEDGTNGGTGAAGTTNHLFIRYASDDSGADFASTWSSGLNYIGILTKANNTAPVADDFTWVQFVYDAYSLFVRYATDANGTGMSTDPAGKTYIGIATGTIAPTNADEYDWSQFVGNDGANGTSYYVFVRYATNNSGAQMTDTWGAGQGLDYIGIGYNTTNDAATATYTWSLFTGGDGSDGSGGNHGTREYIHIRYSVYPDGSGMTESMEIGSNYIGIVVTDSPTAPTDNDDYKWGYFRGDQGSQGNPGSPGAPGQNGTVQYVHVRYATDNEGTGIDDAWSSSMTHMSILISGEITVEDTSFTTWIPINGANGTNGTDGPQGPQGPPGAHGNYIVTTLSGNTLKIDVVKGYVAGGEYTPSDVLATYTITYNGYSIAAVIEEDHFVQFNIADNTGDTPTITGYRFGKRVTVPEVLRIANPIFTDVIGGYEEQVETLKLQVSPSNAELAEGEIFFDYVGDGTLTRADGSGYGDLFNDLEFFNITGVSRTADGNEGDWDITFTLNAEALEAGAAIVGSDPFEFFVGKRFDVLAAYPTNPESFTLMTNGSSDYEQDWSYSRSKNSFTFTNREIVLDDFSVEFDPDELAMVSNAGEQVSSNLLVTSQYNYPFSYVSVDEHSVTIRPYTADGNPVSGMDATISFTGYTLTRADGTADNAKYNYTLEVSQAAFSALRDQYPTNFIVGCYLEFTFTVPYSLASDPAQNGTTDLVVKVTYVDDTLPPYRTTYNIGVAPYTNYTIRTSSAPTRNWLATGSTNANTALSFTGQLPHTGLASSSFTLMIGEQTLEEWLLNEHGYTASSIVYTFAEHQEFTESTDANIWFNAWIDHVNVAPDGTLTQNSAATPSFDHYVSVAITVTIDGTVWNPGAPVYLVLRWE